MTTPWPPVIGAADVPWWARLRDSLLTLAAWLLLAYMLMPMLDALWRLALGLLGIAEAAVEPSLLRLWQGLRPIVGLVLLLAVLMVCYAVVRSLMLKRSIGRTRQSPALDRATHVQYLGLTAPEAERLQQARVMVVEFDDAARLAIVATPEPGPGPTSLPDARP